MGLQSAMQTALTGMQAAETTIDVVGNNVANSNTVGFKESNVLFATQFLQTQSIGSSPTTASGEPANCACAARDGCRKSPSSTTGVWLSRWLAITAASPGGGSADILQRLAEQSGGRYYNEVTALFRKLMTSEDYLQLDVSLGVLAHIRDVFTVRGRAGYGYQTARSVSAEMHSGFMTLRQTWPMHATGSKPHVPLPPEGRGDVARIQAICRWR